MKAEHQTDLDLLEAWRAGDRFAGARLFERHHRSILRFFSSKVGPDCEDLIQATFLACLEGIDRFRGDSSFRTLLFAIAWNKLRRHNIERGRDAARVDPLQSSDDPEPVSAPTFGTLLVAKQEQLFLRSAMLRLPLDIQTMLELHYWEAMPVKEIASVLERTVGAVKTRMKRGREQLEREFAEMRAEGERCRPNRDHDPLPI